MNSSGLRSEAVRLIPVAQGSARVAPFLPRPSRLPGHEGWPDLESSLRVEKGQDSHTAMKT